MSDSARTIVCGFDHAGFALKDATVQAVREAGCEVLDVGTFSSDPVDYPDIARLVAEAIRRGDAERGVLACGSGAGVSIAATKFPGIRAATIHDTYTAHQAVEHDDVNVLCYGARVIGPEVAIELVRTYAAAEFSGAPRHVRRLAKVAEIERAALAGEIAGS